MKKLFCWLFCASLCGVVEGLPIGPKTPSRTESNVPHLNTPVRVLLQKETRHGAVKTPLPRLYVRHGNAAWEKIENLAKIHIEMVNGKPKLFLNGKESPERYFYLRGGPQVTDVVEFQSQKYRGALRISLRGESFLVTNVLPLESYLEGMLASEMSPSWEMEALKSQAVAARSYALYMMTHPKDLLYDLEGGIQDQMYGGVKAENRRVAQAVKATEGLYLGINSEPIKAYFHSRCGGVTETAQTVWKYKATAHKQRVHCAYCQKKKFGWRASVEFEEFFRKLKLKATPKQPFRLLPEVSPSGRVASLTIRTGSESRTVSSDELRSLLGYTRIKSAFFEWHVGEEAIHFTGTGAGHGVGMCQWGTRGLAREGRNHKQILSYYYPDVQLYSHSAPTIAAK